jgi:hypothetical protein
VADAAGGDAAGAADPRDGDGDDVDVVSGPGVWVVSGVRPAGLADRVGLAERVGLADRVGLAERVGLADRVGLGEGSVGVGVAVGLIAGCAGCAGAGVGRTRMYRASTATNRPLSTIVEVRGRPVMGWSRPAGRWQGQPRR